MEPTHWPLSLCFLKLHKENLKYEQNFFIRANCFKWNIMLYTMIHKHKRCLIFYHCINKTIKCWSKCWCLYSRLLSLVFHVVSDITLMMDIKYQQIFFQVTCSSSTSLRTANSVHKLFLCWQFYFLSSLLWKCLFYWNWSIRHTAWTQDDDTWRIKETHCAQSKNWRWNSVSLCSSYILLFKM